MLRVGFELSNGLSIWLDCFVKYRDSTTVKSVLCRKLNTCKQMPFHFLLENLSHPINSSLRLNLTNEQNVLAFHPCALLVS